MLTRKSITVKFLTVSPHAKILPSKLYFEFAFSVPCSAGYEIMCVISKLIKMKCLGILIKWNIYFRPCDRNVKDVELIVIRLRRVEQLYKLPNSVLQQLALCGYYEDLEKGVTRKCCYLLDIAFTHYLLFSLEN